MAGLQGFTEHFIAADDGLVLYARDYGGDNPIASRQLPLVCLAGLSRNSRDFHQLALHLSSHASSPRRVVAVDYRGRGLSDRDPDSSHYQLPVEANDVVRVCSALGVEKADFIGTSRGGLILHLLATSHPALLNRVVLNDIGPVIELAGLLHIRGYLSDPPRFRQWKDVAGHLKTLFGATFPALSQQDWNGMAEALYRMPGADITADYDPALADALKDLTPGVVLPDIWPLFEGLKPFPLLIIKGENSTILSSETAAEMIKRHPDARGFLAKDQGHAPLLHLDGPREALDRFFQTSI